VDKQAVNTAIALRDRYAALLRDSLRVLSKDTTANILNEIEAVLHHLDTTTEDRLAANAMLVGFLTVMCESIEAANEGRTG